MAIRDLLQRFRPAGAPGAPGRAAVPADRVAEATAELAPVFAALADVRSEADGIRSRAQARAAVRRRAAAADAERIRADGHVRAESARGEAFSAARASAQAAHAELVAAAQRDAQALRTRVETRLTGYVDRVVAQALREAALPKADPVAEDSR